jgi:hypothetical protein
MRRAGPILAAAVVLLANAVALIGVARNRAGRPEVEVLLTERELPMAPWSDESTGVFLRLEWQHSLPGSKVDWPWFDRAKLESLGFDSARWEKEVRERYGRMVPRRAYVVLEYDGPAWALWLEAREAEPEETPPGSSRISASRLVPIDVGLDPGELRRLHAERSRYVIVPAIVGAGRTGDGPGGKVVLGGHILYVLVSEIHVPKGLGALLAELRAADAAVPAPPREEARSGPPVLQRRHAPPRYEVLLRYGARHEPWVAEVRPLP